MRYWSRLDPVYEHVNGDSGRLRIRFREKQSTLSDELTYRCTYPGGAEKQKHTLDRAPNHAPVRIRQMQEGGQENA